MELRLISCIAIISSGVLHNGVTVPDGASFFNLNTENVSAFNLTMDQPIERAQLLGVPDKQVAFNGNRLIVYGLPKNKIIRTGKVLKVYTKKPDPVITNIVAVTVDAEQININLVKA